MVRYVVELARELAARPDIDLSVLTTRPSRTFFSDLLGCGQRVWTVPALPTAARSLLERPGYGVPAFRAGFDVVHGTKHLLPVAGRGRRVLTVHDMLPMDRPQDFPWLKRKALVGPYRSSVRSADVLLCVSEATRTRLLIDEPSLASKSVVVPLAMSGSLGRADAKPVPALVGRRFALVVGDASPRKNLSRVVQAWEAVVARDPEAVLVMVGPQGWGVDERGKQFDRLVARGVVIPLGQVSDDILRWCYEQARVVAFPSLLEGFGLPSVEALHFGAPLITSTDSALVEASGEAALHLSPNDTTAWAEALAQAVRRPRSSAAEESNRSWSHVAEGTVRAVRSGGR